MVLVVVALSAVVVTERAAAATWSIVAVDEGTGQVGAAIASCVPADILGSPDQPLVPVVLVPGSAAAITQGQVDLEAPDRIRQLVAARTSADDILAELTRPDFDEVAAVRQHAVVLVSGATDGDRVAAFTGADTNPVALDRQGPTVSVQGNLLIDEAVVTATLDRFEHERDGGSDLVAALARGLAAGSVEGGDRRCPATTALFAQVVVAEAGDAADAPSTVVTVTIAEGDPDNPVELLAAAVDQGRTGWIDASGEPSSEGGVVRVIVLLLAAVILVGGGWVFRRGLGSVRARR